MSAQYELPRKQREMMNHHMDSTVWNDFQFRDDDIVIATWGKSGTTWLQQIVGQMIFGGSDEVNINDLSPWVDLRVPPKADKLAQLEAQTHRRFLKTHLAVDALVFSPRAKYIYIGRDGRDVLWSMYNHHARANDLWYETVNDSPGRVGPPIERPCADIRQYFHEWLDGDGYPFWPFWPNVQSWWDIRQLPNVRLLHFNNLKADLAGEMRHLAAFLEMDIDAAAWPGIVERCSFDYMKNNAEKVVPMAGAVFEGGGQVFINKGVTGRWRDILTADDIAKYESLAAAGLSPDCAHWLATGELAA